jgi:hypothetical protein
MATNAAVPQTGQRVRAQGVIWLAFGLALLAGAGAAMFFSRDNTQLRAYNSAPLCASVADAMDGKDCRYTTTAPVTQLVGDQAGTDIYFHLPGTYGPDYQARLPNAVQLDPSIRVGSQVQVELWMYHVTKFANLITADNPANDPRPGYLQEIAALLALLGVGAAVMARHVWRDDRDQVSMAAAMTPVAASDLMTH